MKTSSIEVLKELERELRMRERVYPDWCKGPNPKIKPSEAQKRIDCINIAIKHFQSIVEQENAQTKLFTEQ
jgi:hypothetical protein